jgi:hypothetical protein
MPNERAPMLNRSTLRAALQAKPDCLTPQQLEKLVGDSSFKDPHLAQCSRCQTELALLMSFESSEPLPDEGAGVAWISARLEQRLDQIKGSPIPRKVDASGEAGSWISKLFGERRSWWLVPVAAALIIAAAGIAFLHRSREPQLRADVGRGPVVYRSQEIEVIAPAGELPEAPKTLQWKAFAGALRYKVSIMEVDQEPLWSGETSDLVLTIPAAIRARMLPRKPLLWRVTALDSQGRTVASSQMQRFSVQLKSSRSADGAVSQ